MSQASDVLVLLRDLSLNKSNIPDAKARLDAFHSTLNELTPLVSRERQKAHLHFIGAYVTLLQAVDPFMRGATEPSETLRVFLARAVDRFRLWLDHAKHRNYKDIALTDCPLPPLDVLIVLHACQLSPHRFYEDGLARLPQLLALGQFPLERVVSSTSSLLSKPLPQSVIGISY